MPRRDFFSFSTSLKPVELKALGELSRVRHLQKGEEIYHVGGNADAVFSVNRGVVKLSRGQAGAGVEGEPLGRGDVFGDFDTLAQLPRLHTATAQEVVSLQCFERANFEELARRVPTFFMFLCEQMAHRTQQQHGPSAANDSGQHLSGDLASFDLFTVHQTIISSGQTGELCVLNENGERVATFYFEEGSPRSGQFQHLTGEEAFWQLFLCDEVPGSFWFSSGAHPITGCIQSAEINKPPNDLLLSALHSRDELQSLKKTMSNPRAPLSRSSERFSWSDEEYAHLRPLAERIWLLIGNHPMSIDELFRHNAVCELKIYLAIAELLRHGLITESSPDLVGVS